MDSGGGISSSPGVVIPEVPGLLGLIDELAGAAAEAAEYAGHTQQLHEGYPAGRLDRGAWGRTATSSTVAAPTSNPFF